MSCPRFCTGLGVSGQPDGTISLVEIYDLIQNPPTPVDKKAARWIIPAANMTRDKRILTEQGQYWCTAIDIDEGNHGLPEVVRAFRSIVPGVGFGTYTTKSNTPAAAKTRTLMGFDRAVSPYRWAAIQYVLTERLAEAGIKVDPSCGIGNQIQFLPNPGDEYGYHIEPGALMDPHGLGPRVAELEAEIRAAVAEAEQRRTSAGKVYGPLSHIGSFVRAYPDEYMLEQAGLRMNRNNPKGSEWGHANQAGGAESTSTLVYPDGGITTRSPTVAAMFDVQVDKLFDAYDIAAALWGREAVKERARQLWLEENNVEYGRQVWEGLQTINGIAKSLWISDPAKAKNACLVLDPDSAQLIPGSVSVADWLHTPKPREWIIDGRIPFREVTLFSGEGGKGKSLLALQLSVSVCCEMDWLGLSVGRQGGVLYVGAEDEANEIHRRLIDITKSYGVELRDLNGLRVLPVSDIDASLITEPNTYAPIQPTAFYHSVLREIEQHRPALVVLDTLADLYPANENDRAKVRRFINLIKRWAREFNCAVVLLSHPSRAGINTGSGDSGSTAWHGSVRSRIYMTGDKDGRQITFKKNQYGSDDEGMIRMKWVAGCFVRTEGQGGPQLGDEQVAAVIEEVRRLWAGIDCDRPRKDVQSPDWIGHIIAAVLGWDSGRGIKKADLTADQQSIRDRIKPYISELMNAGILIERMERDAKKARDIPYIAAGH